MFRSGVALSSVLSVSAVLLIVCFTLAMVALYDLSLASNLRHQVAAEQIARAAVSQFVSEARLQPDPPVDFWRRRFEKPVFPDGGSDLRGAARITFDPEKPWFSTDNGRGASAARGWVDGTRPTASVPPYSVSLIVETEVEGRIAHYEAILRRQWPYVAISTGIISVMGAPAMKKQGGLALPTGETLSPSKVDGALLCLSGPVSLAPMDVGFEGRGYGEPIQVGSEIGSAATWVTPQPPSDGGKRPPVMVGGDLLGLGSSLGQEANQLNGRVDFNVPQAQVPLDPPGARGVYVGPKNTWKGRKRFDVKVNFGKLFSFPAPAGPKLEEVYPDKFTELALPLTPPQKYFLLDEDLEVKPVGSDKAFWIDGSLGNRFEYSLDPPLPGGTDRNTGLTLTDCQLFVNGDLDLSHDEVRPAGTAARVLLKGSNSTLIVNGSLILTNGGLDAQDQEMVIMCRRLVMQADGEFHGVILVEKSAVLFPSDGQFAVNQKPMDRTGLTIKGAILCGGGAIKLRVPTGVAAPPFTVLTYQGLNLWSTNLIYTPRYLRKLNPYAGWEIISLRKLD
ncbi:MAG: hypothetical protein AB1758_25100 [Candidatus Eremiobacterota bacterium]